MDERYDSILLKSTSPFAATEMGRNQGFSAINHRAMAIAANNIFVGLSVVIFASGNSRSAKLRVASQFLKLE
jgi:hypothetical protein